MKKLSGINSKIVIVNQTTNYLTIDVANAFSRQYDEVVLIAGSINDKTRLDKSVIVYDIIKYNRNTVVKRLITWLFATIQITWALLFRYRKSEICFFTNPPSSYLSLLFLSRRNYMVVVYDLFPDSLKVINIKENNYVYKWWAKRNIKLFGSARRLITLSEGMKEAVSQYADRNKIDVIPNWASGEYRVIERESNRFMKEHNWLHKFIILYSGNLGFDYNMDVLIDAANILKDYADLQFVFIGEGGKKQVMKDKVRVLGLNNVEFLQYQPQELLNDVFTSAGVAVVALGDENLDVSMPSKTYDLIAASAPLLCIAGSNSELASFVNQYKNGACFCKSEIEGISNFILHCYKDTAYRNSLSNNSYKASLLFTKANANDYV